ncbi:MAG TPA: SUMF1/EgtB/PvdO family nonheme iron enzyme, partial [Saprospiraceae bacterium]|nr:SUMF1/EgtB/PvdO family nonheme iron enzyme [Saprospiraceae bacterium]
SIFKGMQVQFDNRTVGDCTYYWEFGDDSTSTEVSPKHIYHKEPGDVTVRLTADLGGCKVMQSMTLHILPNPFDNYLKLIPGGNFIMGCTPEQGAMECDPDEEIVHPVTVDTFLMGETEITQGQWLAVMGENPSSSNPDSLDYPVENVTWNDVQVFISKLNATLPEGDKPYRLPTEAEWEYAARGNETFKYAGSDDLDLVAWHSGNSGETTHKVKTKKENGFDLYDMSGNVYEYVEDNYHDTYDGAPQDGSAWNDNPSGTQKVIRGGGCKYDTNNCRTANRTPGDPWTKDPYTGFRLARDY